MKTLSALVPVVILGLLLSSCEMKSIHPLAAPESAKIDPQLVGDWYDKDDGSTFHITAVGAHWMHVLITPKPVKTSEAAGVINNEPQNYDLFTTDIGPDHFLNVVYEQDENGTVSKNYIFFRYAIGPDHALHTWSVSQDAAAAAVHAGKLRGVVDENQHGLTTGTPPHPDFDVTIQDSTENIANFIHTSGANALFSSEMSTLYPGKPPEN